MDYSEPSHDFGGYSTQTLRTGTYIFSGLPPGCYKVVVATQGTDYAAQFYTTADNFHSADTINVSLNQTIENINFELKPGGTVSGTVTDANGKPIQGITVYVTDDAIDCPKGCSTSNVTLTNAPSYISNDPYDYYNSYNPFNDYNPITVSAITSMDGTYTINGLATGTYRVYADNSGMGYPSEYFNNTTEYHSATPVPVTAGEVTDKIDFSLALDYEDKCPGDPYKMEPGVCGCNVADTDSDSDGTPDCNDPDDDDDGLPDNWELQYDLDPYVNDANEDKDGDKFSNFQEYKYGTNPSDNTSSPPNHAPTAPSVNYPSDNSEATSLNPVLSVNNSTDADGHALVYSFDVYSDPEGTKIIASSPDISEGENATQWQVIMVLNDNTNYYWKVRVSDDIDSNSEMNIACFFVNTENDPPTIPGMNSPQNETEVSDIQPVLTVTNSSDPDRDPLTYDFNLYSDANGDENALVTSKTGVFEENDGTTSWQVEIELADNTSYWWKTQARDDEDMVSGWSSLFKFSLDTSINSPSMPVINSPQNGVEVDTLTPELGINNSEDPDGDTLTYFFEIDKTNAFNPSIEKSLEIGENPSGITSWSASELDDNTTYFWRAIAFDGASYSENWTSGSFFINLLNDPPSVPVIKNPTDASIVNTQNPELSVYPSNDIDGDQITYEFKLYSDSNKINLVDEKNGVETLWTVDANLTSHETYYWEVRAVDEHGEPSDALLEASFTVNVNSQPTSPILNNPVSGGTVTSLKPTLSVNNSTDQDGDVLAYEFQLFADKEEINIVDSATVAQGNQITSWAVTKELNDNTLYYWRVRTTDGDFKSSWMSTSVFVVKTSGSETTVNIEASLPVSASSQDIISLKVEKNESPINGVTVEIPAGALSDDCTITIGEVTNPPALPANVNAIGRIIEFGPSGITFTNPVTIMIPYTQEDLDNASVSDPGELEVFTYDVSTLSWKKVNVDKVNKTEGLLVCKVSHFSMYTTGKTTEETPDENTQPSSPPVTPGGGDGSSGGGCFISIVKK